MRLSNKKHWIVLLVAMLLSSKVFASLQWCAHDAVNHPTQGAHTSVVSVNHATAAGDEDGCCDKQAEQQSGDSSDCCAALTVQHRNVPKPCICGSGFASVSIDSYRMPRALFQAAVVHLPPAIPVAGPSLNILFKNFRA